MIGLLKFELPKQSNRTIHIQSIMMMDLLKETLNLHCLINWQVIPEKKEKNSNGGIRLCSSEFRRHLIFQAGQEKALIPPLHAML